MGKISSKAKKLKLNAAKFLKIVPERIKKISTAGTDDIKPINEYRPNAIASVIHPEVQHVKVSETVKLSDKVKLFKLIPDKEAGTERLAPFAAGACISAEIIIDGRIYRRPYSISSSPLEGYYEIIIKKTPGGIVSSYFFDCVEQGFSFNISEPFGEFTYNSIRDAKTVIGVAGGVGITPFRSYIKAISDGAESFELILLYGVDSPDDIIMKDELDKACKSSKIKVIYVVSGNEDVSNDFRSGFITADLIKEYAPEGDYSVFVCGPEAMYNFMSEELQKLGIRKKFIRFDYKGAPLRPDKEPDYKLPFDLSFDITVSRRGINKVISCMSDETLMKAIERSGIDIPSKCMSGACGFCHTKVISGDYYIPVSRDGRREADKIYNYIHPCCTFPRSDMEILLP